MKIIFLDIDGVLNSEQFFDKITDKDREYFRNFKGKCKFFICKIHKKYKIKNKNLD